MYGSEGEYEAREVKEGRIREGGGRVVKGEGGERRGGRWGKLGRWSVEGGR